MLTEGLLVLGPCVSSGSPLTLFPAFLTSLRIWQPRNSVWTLLHDILHPVPQKQKQSWGFLPEIYWGVALSEVRETEWGWEKLRKDVVSGEVQPQPDPRGECWREDSDRRPSHPGAGRVGCYPATAGSGGQRACLFPVLREKLQLQQLQTRICYLTVSVVEAPGHSPAGSPAQGLRL